jgi:hypothetical protein
MEDTMARTRRVGVVGNVYLLHFGRPYCRARHYLGFSGDVERRVREHCRGRGSPLVRAVVAEGTEVFIARRWEQVTRAFERRIHNHHKNGRACPICKGPKAFRRCRPRRHPATGVGI